MADNSLKIYPSGFLGSSVNPQTLPLDLISKAKQLFNNALVTKVSPYTASLDVIELWQVAISGSSEHNTFEFSERVLRYAISAFGVDQLLDWLDAQISSPEYNDNHSRWIDETIEYVFGGRRRNLSDNNWIMLLHAGDNEPLKRGYSDTVKRYLLTGSILENRSNITIKNFILHWVRQPNGIHDLLSSLNVLYGKR